MFYTQKEKNETYEDILHVRRSLLVEISDVEAELSENILTSARIMYAIAMASNVSPKKLASMFTMDTPEILEYQKKFSDELVAQLDKELKKKEKKTKKPGKTK